MASLSSVEDLHRHWEDVHNDNATVRITLLNGSLVERYRQSCWLQYNLWVLQAIKSMRLYRGMWLLL